MAEPLTSEETRKRWNLLLSIQRLQPIPDKKSMRKRSRPWDSNSVVAPEDPFDCSAIKVPPTFDVAEATIQRFLKKWKELDERKVASKRSHPNTGSGDDDTRGNETTNGKLQNDSTVTFTKGWRAMQDRLTLPEGFDYTTSKRNEPPIDDEQYEVISLENPSERLSYHGELWKLFRSIPSYQQLEEDTRRGHEVHNTLKVHNETQEFIKGTSLVDVYMLSRLRSPDRHGLPSQPPFLSSSRQQAERGSPRSSCDTLIFEFWRRQPKPGGTSDCNRMVAEFLATQTLWDVHMLLSQMTEDDLWAAIMEDAGDDEDRTNVGEQAGKNHRFRSRTKGPEKSNDANRISDTAHHECDDSCSQEALESSGCFFIENTFYKTGPVEYANSIVDWIERSHGSKKKSIRLRRQCLGIDATVDITEPHHKSMKETQLNKVPFRLNVRYHHACHGDVETTVMLVDRTIHTAPTTPSAASIATDDIHKEAEDSHERIAFPLLHDIWTIPRSRFPMGSICDACQTYQAIFQTSLSCKSTDGGPRSLCMECCKDLELLEREPEAVKLNRVWRGQLLLSNGLARANDTSFSA